MLRIDAPLGSKGLDKLFLSNHATVIRTNIATKC